MSETRQALAELNSFIVALRRAGPPGAQSECSRRAEEIQALDEAEPLPSDDLLARLRRDLQMSCASDAVSTIPPRLLRSAPLVFWNGQPQAAGFPKLLDEFFRRTMDSPQPRQRWVRNIIEAWLRDFGPDKIRHTEAGKAISLMLSRGQASNLQLWRSADTKFALFDAAEGPKRVARHLVAGPESVPDILQQIGMDDPLRATGGFFRAAVAQLVSELPQSLNGRTAGPAWERSAGLLEVTRRVPVPGDKAFLEKELRFPEMSGDIARASLSPWLSGEPATAAPRDPIKAFLVRNLGDPRVDRRYWAGAGDAADHLMKSWLASASLEAFLSLITQSNDDQQWRYRQAFWRACVEKVPNAEVWVVLGSALSGRAGAIRDLNGSFAAFENCSAGDQAVLLMQLGDLTFSEWSNVGRVRAWAKGSSNCPKLYQPIYNTRALTSRCLDFPDHPTRGRGGSAGGKGLIHYSNQTSPGLWQGCAAALLRNRGIASLSEKDYMPTTS